MARYYQKGAVTVFEDFSDITDWTLTVSGGGSISENTSYVIAGTKSLRFYAESGQNAYATRDVTFNLSASGGFWIRFYTAQCPYSQQTGITLYLSHSTGLASGVGRVSKALNVAFQPGWNTAWVSNAGWTTLDGAPNFANDWLSIRVRIDGSTLPRELVLDAVTTHIGRAKCIMTFDDGYGASVTASNYASARGVPMTHYLIASLIGADNYMTVANLGTLLANGDCLGVHGASTWTTTSRIATDKAALEALGVTISPHAAWPLGDDGNLTANAWESPFAAAQAAGLLTVRGTRTRTFAAYDGGYQPLSYPSYPLNNATSLTNAKAYVDEAIAIGATVAFYGHKLGTADSETWTQSDFEALVDYLQTKQKAGAIECVTVDEWYEGLQLDRAASGYSMGMVSGPLYGFTLDADGSAYNNTIESSRRGLRVANTGTNVIKNCHFKNTSGPAIKVEAGCTVTSDYNHFDSEYAGMLVDESGNSYATVAAWTAATSRDANSTIGTRAVGNGLRDGVWVAGVRAADDLPIPLHPDRGADQDRTAPGRRFGVGGGTL